MHLKDTQWVAQCADTVPGSIKWVTFEENFPKDYQEFIHFRNKYNAWGPTHGVNLLKMIGTDGIPYSMNRLQVCRI